VKLKLERFLAKNVRCLKDVSNMTRAEEKTFLGEIQELGQRHTVNVHYFNLGYLGEDNEDDLLPDPDNFVGLLVLHLETSSMFGDFDGLIHIVFCGVSRDIIMLYRLKYGGELIADPFLLPNR
jgi:hypothetical protein